MKKSEKIVPLKAKLREKLLISLLFLVAVVIVVQLFAGFNQKEETVEVKQPATQQMQDFPASDAGTFMGTLQEKYFKEKMDDAVVLFVSSKISGLSLIYYPKEKRITGGLPILSAEDISLFDGKQHQLGYSFQKSGQQLIIYDGKVVASGDFHPLPGRITGMMIGVIGSSVSNSLERYEFK